MPVVWVSRQGEEVPWGVVDLGREAQIVLTGEKKPPVRRPGGGETGRELPLAVRCEASGQEEWVLVAGASGRVRVNGMPLCLGIRVLRDKDEIVVDGQRVFFSTERLAEVERFPGAERAVFCPRCKQEIEAGSDAVRCPQCGLWHHETAELNCWTYAPTCGNCPQSTELGGDYRWIPEG